MNIDKIFSQLLNQSLGFVIPSHEEIIAISLNKDLYREYNMTLAYMQDHLVEYSNLPFHPRMTKPESKKHIQETIANPLMTPLVDNLIRNQAIVLQLSEIAHSDAEIAKPFIDNFLNEMAHWLNHFKFALDNEENIIDYIERVVTPNKQHLKRQNTYKDLSEIFNFAIMIEKALQQSNLAFSTDEQITKNA